MSKNFLRVKRDLLQEMADIPHHTQESWAEIMLKYSQFLTTEQDQQSFWNFILNPADDRDYKAPEFYKYDPLNVEIPEFQKMSIKSEEDEKMEELTLVNEEVRNGLTCYISTRVEWRSW